MRIIVAPQGGDFTSLGEAIARAPADANILVVPGTYVELSMPIVVSKPLSITLGSPTAQCRGNGCSAVIVPSVNTK
ncbi:hypothetical protein Pelo_8572 [Pelomyxa schiedti]|nr:hypothetical protein Pelo_8572 [Pelomyxa schiedti]